MQNYRTVGLEIITFSYQQCIGHCRWKSTAATSSQTNQYSKKENKHVFVFVWACCLVWVKRGWIRNAWHVRVCSTQMVLTESVLPFLLLLLVIYLASKYNLWSYPPGLFQAVTLFHQSLFIKKTIALQYKIMTRWSNISDYFFTGRSYL